MNPLTQIKNTQKATRREIEAGISDSASWHARFKHSAYIFSGGLDYDLTEGDLLAVFAQYGEVVDMNLIRDKDSGKSKGFAFVAYEDQRSTTVAVDNLNGAKVAGRTIRVEHVDNYKKRKAELEGEDPNAVESDGEEANGARGDAAAGGAQAAAGDRRLGGPPARGRSPPPAGPARSAAPSNEPWAGSGSIFALLEEARQLESAKQDARKGNQSKEEAGTSGRGAPAAGGRRPDPEPASAPHREGGARGGGSATPAPSFGPPRPPPRPSADTRAAAGPGPGSSRDGGYERGGDRGRDEQYAREGRGRDGFQEGRPGAGRSRSPGEGRRGDRDFGGGGDRDRPRGADRGRDVDLERERERGWEKGRAQERPRERSRSAERDGQPQGAGRWRERGRDRER